MIKFKSKLQIIFVYKKSLCFKIKFVLLKENFRNSIFKNDVYVIYGGV